jgi:hypothetical protein
MSRIYRYEVPVDDLWHIHNLRGDIVHVGCREVSVVEFWATHDPDNYPPVQRWFQVFGTGQPLPDSADYRGTAVAGPLVWHLYERRN